MRAYSIVSKALTPVAVVRPYLAGISTYIPGLYKLLSYTGGSSSARYCYATWMRHLILSQKHARKKFPKQVAELGPGDSLGTAIAALLCGVEQVHVFDVVKYAPLDRNLAMIDELVELFNSRARIPDSNEFPQIKPALDSYDFPSHILSDAWLKKSLNSARVAKIRESVAKNNGMITYQVPWNDARVLKPNSMDLIFSQAVMEHVNDVAATYAAMSQWLKHDGVLTHQIDFRCHGTAAQWNGHWMYSDFAWRIIQGNRPYFLNKKPFSYHKRCLELLSFKIVKEIPAKRANSPKIYTLADVNSKLRAEFVASDLDIAGAFVVAIRKK